MSDTNGPGGTPEESVVTGDSAVASDSGIEPWLREILRCPACLCELVDAVGPEGGPELVCTGAECGRAYRIEDGIPVLLVDEARAGTSGPAPTPTPAPAPTPA